MLDNSCTMEDSSRVSDFATTTIVTVSDPTIASTSYISAVEEQIERSKCDWSTLADLSDNTDEEGVDFKVSNEQEFLALQRHPQWGSFFANFSGDGISTGIGDVLGELLMGRKFAEGGQAELYEVEIKWNDPRNAAIHLKNELGCVLKVFKQGTLLNQVKSQFPEGLLLLSIEWQRRLRHPTPVILNMRISNIHFMIMLKDGRFGFLMIREHFDLRTLVEREMKLRGGGDCGPFSKDEAQLLMYYVGLGVITLHNRDIIHRDLKASNILVHEFKTGYPKWICNVADYECSIGVVGTNFFRAPEILQVCKDRKVKGMPEVFSKASDVYSYGMICFEILTGKLPFEDHPLNTSPSLLIDLVINQHLCPEVPEYVEDWISDLLESCWQFDPIRRPKIGQILNTLSSNSTDVQRLESFFKKEYGDHFVEY